MSNDVRNLEPKSLWGNFADLNAVPRPSKKEEKVIAFAKNFGENLGLATIVDDIGNVIIKKPASAGMEDKPTVVLQSHLDMVHQKNAATQFDFDKEGIKMYVDGDWVRAKGTTLGADNGIGVASIMAILESSDIPHPAIEALFTIDEETGMTGAKGLKGGLLDGSILLNLDTEDDDELTIGCAGGIDVEITGKYEMENIDSNAITYKVSVKGLTGGHSGMDIYKGRANANKLINRLLYGASKNYGIQINSIDGGGLRNAIPREANAIISVSNENDNALKQFIDEEKSIYAKEYATTDPALDIILEKTASTGNALSKAFQKDFLRAVYACPNGIYRMSPDMEHVVQTSNNIARILVGDGTYTVQCLTRSSVDSEKMDLGQTIKSAFTLIGADVNLDGAYPGWTPKPEAAIIKMMRDLYKERYNEAPKVSSIHAGLECGILGTNYPDMDMISFGPNIRGAHSPDECCQISSVQKYWGFLLEALKRV